MNPENFDAMLRGCKQSDGAVVRACLQVHITEDLDRQEMVRDVDVRLCVVELL
jgi:hypothetical protein